MTRVIASILSYDSIDTLRQTLQAVAEQSVQPDRVIVVDNASRDGTVDELRTSWPSVEVLAFDENRGVGAGHNAGWRAALNDSNVDAVWALEHDSWPTPTCLARLIETWRDSEATGRPVGAVHPRQVSRHVAGAPHNRTTGRIASRLLHLNGALLPTAALRSAGLLREDFFVGQEDREFGWRLSTSGWQTIRDNEAVVVHQNYRDARKTRTTVARRYYGWRNDAYLRVRVIEEPGARLTILAGTAATIARVALHGPRRTAYMRARIRATVDAFRGNLGRKDYRFLRSE